MMRRLGSVLSRRTVWIPLFSLIWLVLLLFDVVPILRGGFGWVWNYMPLRDLRRLAPLILGIVIYVPVALWLVRRRSAAALLVWAVAGSVGLPFAAVYVRGDLLYRLYLSTAGGWDGGWHMAAAQITDLPEALRRWPAFMKDMVISTHHMGHSPPGMVMIYYAVSAALARFPELSQALAYPLRPLLCLDFSYTSARYASAWLGLLMPVWSSLTILPLYFLGRRVYGRETARWSVLWWPVIPSYLIFTPTNNIFYPLPTLILICLVMAGLEGNKKRWMLAAGVWMSGLTFMTFTFLPLLLLAGLLTLGMFGLRKSRPSSAPAAWHWPLMMGTWFGVGLTTLWILYYLTAGVGIWDILAASSEQHLALVRPYAPWLILHLNDFFMFTGWPVTLLAGVGVWLVVRKLISKRPLETSDVMTLAAMLTIILLDLSGTLRGESGRILLFLSPWVLFAAANALKGEPRLGGMVTAVQAVVAVGMIGSLSVIFTPYAPERPLPPPPPYAEIPGTEMRGSGAVFGDSVRLEAYSGFYEAGNAGSGSQSPNVVLWLKWTTLRFPAQNYAYAVIPVAPDGQAAPEATLRAPFEGHWPMTCWKPADGGLQDQLAVPLFKSQTGAWWVSLALIDKATGEALEVVLPDGTRDDQVGLGPFR